MCHPHEQHCREVVGWPEVEEQVAVAMAKAKERNCLKHLAYTDGLTSLFNLDMLREFLSQECHRNERNSHSFALLMLDIDNFGQYNELNGRLIGDIALIKLGRLLKQWTRTSDITARYGRDEFAVILTDTALPEALVRANRIRRLVSSTLFQRERNIPGKKLMVSIGVDLYPQHGHDFRRIIDNANHALRQAKAQGPNRVCVYAEPAEAD